MSFSFSYAGKREDVLAAIGKSIEEQRKYSNDVSQADRVNGAATERADALV